MCVAQAFVAGPAEGGVAAFAGLDGDGGLAGVGGEAVGGGVAGAVVADLGEQAGGADDALGVAEQRGRSGRRGGRGRRRRSGWSSWLICATIGRSAATRPSTALRRASVSSSPTRADRGAAQPVEQLVGGSCVRSRRGGRGTPAGAWGPRPWASAGRGSARGTRARSGCRRRRRCRVAPGQKRVELGAQLVGQRDAGADEILAGADRARAARWSRRWSGASARKRWLSVRASSQSTNASKRSVLPAAARKRSRAAATWLGWIAITRQPGLQQPVDQQPVGPLDRDPLDACSHQQRRSAPRCRPRRGRSAARQQRSGRPRRRRGRRASRWPSRFRQIAGIGGPPRSRSLSRRPTARYRGGCS